MYPDPTAPGSQPDPAGSPEIHGLHVCPSCGSGLMQRRTAEPAFGDAWHVELWCPECRTLHVGLFRHRAVAALEAELAHGEELLEAALAASESRRFAEEIERFTRALAAGHVLPEDF